MVSSCGILPSGLISASGVADVLTQGRTPVTRGVTQGLQGTTAGHGSIYTAATTTVVDRVALGLELLAVTVLLMLVLSIVTV